MDFDVVVLFAVIILVMLFFPLRLFFSEVLEIKP